MIFFINNKIENEFLELSKKFAIDATIEVKRNKIVINWSELSYKLGAMKFCNALIKEYRLYEYAEIDYLPNRLILFNIKDKNTLLNKIKEINLFYK